MKNHNTVGLLAAIGFAVGMIGVNFVDGTFATFDKTSDVPAETGMFSGHLELIHTDPEGNIKSYIQTDNAIVSEGENCVALDLFGGGNGCSANPGVFNVIALTNTATTGLDSTTLAGELSGSGLTRVAGNTASIQQANSGGGNATNIVRISTTFTYTGASQGVSGAGLFNSTDTNNDAMFSLKDFTPSGVTLTTNDQLTVNWDITTSGSTAFS